MHYIVASVDILPVAYVGLCLYSACHPSFLTSAEKETLALLEQLTGRTDLAQFGLTFWDQEENHRQLREDQDLGYTLTAYLCVLLALLAVFGAAVHKSRCLDRGPARLAAEGLPEDPADRSDQQLVASKNGWGRLLLAFAATRNIERLVKIEAWSPCEGSEDRKGVEGVWAGVRALSLMWVVLVHASLTTLFGVNIRDVPAILNSTFGTLVQGGFYGYDAFFAMAAFLGGQALLTQLERGAGLRGLGLAWLYRWYRLAPSIAFALLASLFIFPRWLFGPLGFEWVGPGIAQCRDYWWSTLLLINNFYPWAYAEGCLNWTWYLACDFDFFVITAPLVWLLHRWPAVGFTINLLLLLGSVASALAVTYVYDIRLPSIAPDFFDQYATKPWNRLAAYQVGLLAAAIAHQRRSPSHACGGRLGLRLFRLWQRSTCAAYASLITGFVFTAFVVFIYQAASDKSWGAWGIVPSMLYNALSRPLFVTGMLLALLPTLSGQLGWLRGALSHPALVVLGRLTLPTFLLHVMVLQVFAYSQHSTNYFALDNTVLRYLGLLSLSYCGGLLLHLLVEAPFLHLERFICAPRLPRTLFKPAHPLFPEAEPPTPLPSVPPSANPSIVSSRSVSQADSSAGDETADISQLQSTITQ